MSELCTHKTVLTLPTGDGFISSMFWNHKNALLLNVSPVLQEYHFKAGSVKLGKKTVVEEREILVLVWFSIFPLVLIYNLCICWAKIRRYITHIQTLSPTTTHSSRCWPNVVCKAKKKIKEFALVCRSKTLCLEQNFLCVSLCVQCANHCVTMYLYKSYTEFAASIFNRRNCCWDVRKYSIASKDAKWEEPSHL